MPLRSLASTSLISILALAACVSDGDQVDLLNREWVVHDISGTGVIDGSEPTLAFGEDGSLSGNASCNRLQLGSGCRAGNIGGLGDFLPYIVRRLDLITPLTKRATARVFDQLALVVAYVVASGVVEAEI